MYFLKLAFKIGGWGSIVMAITVLTISLFIYLHTRSFVRSATQTQGTVVKLDQEDSRSGSFPIVSFRDARGQEHEFTSSVSQNPPAYKVGDAVAVLYQTGQPGNAKINSFFEVWGWNLILGGIGVGNFVFGLVMLAVASKIPGEKRQPAMPGHLPMDISQDAILEISFPKVLLVSTAMVVLFMMGCSLVLGLPFRDPLFSVFLVVMVPVTSFAFASCFYFMLQCKIGRDGLRPALPTFYQRVLRWEDITYVRGFGSPFYYVGSGLFGGRCLLPRRFLLKRPDHLKEFIERYAPADNIVRKKLAD